MEPQTPERMPPPVAMAEGEQMQSEEQMGYPHLYNGWKREEIYQKTIDENKYMLPSEDFHMVYNPLNRSGEIPPIHRSDFNNLMDEFIGCFIQGGEGANIFN